MTPLEAAAAEIVRLRGGGGEGVGTQPHGREVWAYKNKPRTCKIMQVLSCVLKLRFEVRFDFSGCVFCVLRFAKHSLRFENTSCVLNRLRFENTAF